MAARRALKHAPPMSLDWLQWLPVLQAYEAGTNAYFGTPATTLIPALEVSLEELLSEGMPTVFQRHAHAADRLRAAWQALGLRAVASHPANTLSALYWPEGVDATALPAIKARGAIVAGGLHPAIKTRYFRVGHMGAVTRDAEALRRTVGAVAHGLADAGAALDPEAGLAAFDQSS